MVVLVLFMHVSFGLSPEFYLLLQRTAMNSSVCVFFLWGRGLNISFHFIGVHELDSKWMFNFVYCVVHHIEFRQQSWGTAETKPLILVF